MQIKKGQTVADEVLVTTPYQDKIPIDELKNPYYLQWMATLIMEQNSGTCDADITKGAFTNDGTGLKNRGTFVADAAAQCPEKCATFGFCASFE